jgi:hypothetical protein
MVERCLGRSLGCSTDLHIRRQVLGLQASIAVLGGGVGNAVTVVVIYMVLDFVGQTIIQPLFTAAQ